MGLMQGTKHPMFQGLLDSLQMGCLMACEAVDEGGELPWECHHWGVSNTLK